MNFHNDNILKTVIGCENMIGFEKLTQFVKLKIKIKFKFADIQ
jgi:hypothetical protein